MIFLPDSDENEEEKIPNEDTVNAFQETDNGVGLKKFNSVDALFKDLES